MEGMDPDECSRWRRSDRLQYYSTVYYDTVHCRTVQYSECYLLCTTSCISSLSVFQMSMAVGWRMDGLLHVHVHNRLRYKVGYNDTVIWWLR